ncbi:MAG: LytTR family DNA-binding domain-containing protein [Flavobacteriaceae bacterium]
MALVFYFVYSPVYDNWGDRIYDYLDTVRLVGLVAIVPYAIVVLCLGFNKRLSALKDAEKNTRNSFSGKENKLLTIRGENEKVILAIEYHQLLYIKSAGNYLELFYLKGDKQAKELVRTRLKELEKKLSDTNIVKVHRSYLINVRHISSFKKTRKGYALIMKYIPDTIIPVSAGFKSVFEEALEQKVSH